MTAPVLRNPIPLYLAALRLARAAQQVRHTRVDVVIPELLAEPDLPRNVEPRAAVRAARLACGILGRLRQLNSCLTRSLVLGTLISDRPGVTIHLGFRPGPGDTEGHAWISLDDRVLGFSQEEQDNFADYTIAQSLPMQRLTGGMHARSHP